MYIQKSPHGVYYARICTPAQLKALGFPFDLKISLRTKDPKLAKVIGLSLVSAVKEAFRTTDSLCFSEFQFHLKDILSHHLNLQSQKQDDRLHLGCIPFISHTSKRLSEEKHWSEALEHFLEFKEVQGVSALTVHQLKQRITFFFESTAPSGLSTITAMALMEYIRTLNSSSLSAKSCKDYYAALSQFIRWCATMSLIERNVSADIKATFKKSIKADKQRSRWSESQLSTLFSSEQFQQVDNGFYWVTLLLTYMGMRPNEVCQLRTEDVVVSGPVPYLNVTDEGHAQRIKNRYALRQVPIHQSLIKHGFLEYIDLRKNNSKTCLFDYKPLGLNKDWSQQYCQQFGRLLSKIGLKAGQRPTAYSLRHTFIDVLKQKEVAESTVADIVGHHHPSMTFGRYGKQTKLKLMLSAVNQFSLQLGGSHE
ncbi:site-specific integrase [Vibrio splendidus]|uniref:site-specific integrase n=1 Tax=Vibrio splendidus TaxID=29497 RepID=UPI000C864E6C|nr:site-specific integrase [Vibrio splendidus]PMJ78287.1 hypothetical protein BCU23_13405 [Vibrio splendidus]